MPVNVSLFCQPLLRIFLLLSISFHVFSQQEINTSPYYDLANYRIYPQEKIIKLWGEFGSCSNGMCYENNGYTAVKHIDFDSTALVFIDRQMYFKEDLSDVDLNTLTAIYPDTPVSYGGQRYHSPIFSDKKNLYISSFHNALTNSESPYRIPLPQMQRLNPYLFKNDQNEYFIILRTFNKPEEAIQKIDDVKLDPNTLKYVVGSFYTDKNGLYLLGNFYNDNTHQYEKNKKVEDSHGQLVIPKITKNTISYGEAIYGKNERLLAKYPYPSRDVVKRIGNYDILKNGKVTSGYYKNPAPEEFAIYPFIADAYPACIFEQDGELYFKGTQKVKNGYTYGLLFKTDQDYISVNYHNGEKEIKHFKQLNIYNVTKNTYEPFEIKRYRQVDEDFYIYKGALYGYGAPTFSHDPRINYAKLQRISYSNYYTDGKYMFYNSQTDRYRYAPNYARTFEPINPNMIINNVDFATLEIVNENLLIDKNRIYTIKNTTEPGIDAIPRNKLGIKTIVIGAVKYQ